MKAVISRGHTETKYPNDHSWDKLYTRVKIQQCSSEIDSILAVQSENWAHSKEYI